MLEERFLKIFQNNVDDQYNELNKFLSSSVEFSDIDIDFFLNKISNNTILRVLCTDSFLSSESRILSVIRYCEKNPQMIYPLVKGIKSAIRPPKLTFAKFIFKNFPFHFLKDEMRDGLDLYEKITEKNPHYLFLFKKFPLKIFETILAFGGAPYWSEGVDIFYFLCGVYQSHIIYHKALNRQCLNPSTFVSKVCEFLPREKFIEYIPILTKYNGIKQHIKRKRKLLLERVKNIVEINYTYPPHQVSYSTFIIERIILERVAHSSKN